MTVPALASDELVQALARRGFVPWASDYVGEPKFQPGADGIILGSGFLLRLPVKAEARQFLVAAGEKVVIVDRINEVGPLGLSSEAAEGLGLPTYGATSSPPVTLQIIALQRRIVATAGAARQSAPQAKAPPKPKPKPASPVDVQVKPVQKTVFIPPEDVRSEPAPSVVLQTPTFPTLGAPELPVKRVDETEAEASTVSFLESVFPTETTDPKPDSPDKISFTIASRNETLFDWVMAGGDLSVDFEGEDSPETYEVVSTEANIQPNSSIAPNRAPLPPPRIKPTSTSPKTAIRTAPTKEQGLFLQVGFFRNRGNADRLHAKLKSLGFPAVVRTERIEDTQHWRVLTGPFPNSTARQAAKIRGGALLSDAYPIRLR